MKTSLRRIRTKDNIELVGLLYEPENETKEIVVHVHGMSGNFYENIFLDFLAKTLTDSGVAFFSFNNRGCEFMKDLIRIEGERRNVIRIGDTYEIFEDCLLDIKSAIDFAALQGYEKIHLQGHSLGASKIAYYAVAGNDSRLSSIIFLAPSDMVGLSIEDKNYERDLEISKKMIAEGKGKQLFPDPVWEDCFLSAQSYVSLGSKDSNVAIFNFHNPADALSVLTQIKSPTLTITGGKDSSLVIPVEKAMERIKNAMSNSLKVETNILGEANHGYMGYEQKLADTVLDWVKKIGK